MIDMEENCVIGERNIFGGSITVRVGISVYDESIDDACIRERALNIAADKCGTTKEQCHILQHSRYPLPDRCGTEEVFDIGVDLTRKTFDEMAIRLAIADMFNVDPSTIVFRMRNNEVTASGYPTIHTMRRR